MKTKKEKKEVEDLIKEEEVKNKLPDMIYSGITKNFTVISNEIIINKELTMKAKGLLLLLLSNKKGWKTYEKSLLKRMKDGITSLRTTLTELEENKYLYRVRYHSKGIRKGVIYVYGDIPDAIDLTETIDLIEKNGFAASVGRYKRKPNSTKPNSRKPNIREQPTNKNNNKKTKKNKTISLLRNSSVISTKLTNKEKSKYIQPIQFTEFMELYPKRPSNNLAKAKIAWLKICKYPYNSTKISRPKWKEIKKAIKSHKKSEQWKHAVKTKKLRKIPMAVTWLNQGRWINDAKDMKKFEDYNKQPNTQIGHKDKKNNPYKQKVKTVKY